MERNEQSIPDINVYKFIQSNIKLMNDMFG